MIQSIRLNSVNQFNDTGKELSRASSNSTAWIPPNDRELIIRAKLQTGWSSRSSNTNTNINKSPSNNSTNTSMSTSYSNISISDKSLQNPLINEYEYNEIENVLKRASLIDKKEENRIHKLLDRFISINKPLGNGETTCIICNLNFSLLNTQSPKICCHCLKNVCSTCSIDSPLFGKSGSVLLCLICSEYKEYLKKSGAWFNNKIPSNISSTAFTKPEIQIQISSTPITIYNEENNLNTTNTTDQIKKSSSSDKCNELKTKSRGKLDRLVSKSSEKLDRIKSKSSEKLHRSPPKKKDNESLKDEDNFNELSKNDDDDDITKYFSTKSLNNMNKVNNSELINIDLELESKLLYEQIAASKNLNSTALTQNNSKQLACTALLNSANNTNDLSLNNESNNNNHNSNKHLSKTSTLDKNSMNISDAFKHFKYSENRLGHLQFNVEYIQSLLQLKIHLISASSLAARDSNGLSDPYVKIHLLPGIAKATKLRSKTVYKNLNPFFNEEFHYDGVTIQDLDAKTLRFTVLDEDKFGFDFIGEYRLPLNTLIRNEVNHFNVPLEDKQELGDETDTTSRGKINFAVKYSKKTSCLYVKINRCTQLLPMDNGVSSDPFVEVALLPGSKENKYKFKTSTKRKTLDPEYIEEFKFSDIDLSTLLTKTIEISVWDKDFTKNDFIGLVQLSQHRSGEELKHFFTVVKNPELYHEKWHTLHLKDEENITVY